MERLTKTHYISGNGHYMACSELNSCCDKECSTCNHLDEIVERLAAYEDTGLEPEEVTALQKDWSELCTVIGECGGIDRLRELAEADKDGRVVVLPFTSGHTLLCKENIDSLRLMKDVELAIRYCSSCGIVFHMGYNVFCDLVKHGRITAVSEEAEKALMEANGK